MYTIIDIESNGAGYRKESVIEVAIYRYDGHEITDQFISLVNPDADITPFVQKLTRITPKMVKTAPKFHEIAKRIVEITEGTTLVGHNIEFDYRMLRQEFQRLGYEFKINTIDTIPLAKKLIPEAPSYSLAKLVKSLGIPLTDAHRASGDARATLELFKLLMIKDNSAEILQQHYEESNAQTYLNRVKEVTRDLPGARGIVYFQNAEGKILLSDYVDDINKFSKKIFNSKSKKHASIQESTEQIHYELVGNDLIAALILKSKGIRKSTSLPFGLSMKDGKFLIQKNNSTEEVPVLKFRSYTQGMKALNFIKSNNQFSDPEALLATLDLKNNDGLWLMPGRVLGEKAFVQVAKGRPVAFGFYDLYIQIQSRKHIDQLKIPVQTTATEILNDMKMLLLKREAEVVPIPD